VSSWTDSLSRKTLVQASHDAMVATMDGWWAEGSDAPDTIEAAALLEELS